MRFRRRRKPRVVWLSNSGTPFFAGFAAGQQPAFTEFQGVVNLGAGLAPTVEVPLLVDGPDITQMGSALGTYQGFNLNDVQQPGYLFRRLVGKFHCGVFAGSDDNQQFPDERCALQITAGLIVRRVDDSGAAIAGGPEVNAITIQNIKDPWIWRRTWVLRNSNITPETSRALFTGTRGAIFGSFPATTSEYGSVLDGPHVDAKSKRVVGAEERLFLDVSVMNMSGEEQVAWTLFYRLDYRVLASLRFSGGNRKNASR